MNRASLENSCFSFLEHSIGVLIVEDEPAVAELHFEHLNSYKLYHVVCASSIKEAESVLSSSRRFHVCLLDLGLEDFDHDEYYLIRKYSPRMSFIVVSARDSLEKGFQAGTCGALAIINKPVDFYKIDFIDQINAAFFKSLLVPDNQSKCKPVIKDAIDAFLSSKPASVIHWANKVGVEERYLRKVWKECFEYPLKYVPWFHRIFSHAFSNYKSMYCEEFGIEEGKTDITANDDEYINKRFKSFYHTHKIAIESILRRLLWKNSIHSVIPSK